jgi:hypothetical protein
MSLQKFHREQPKGKSALSEPELYVVITNGFRFLASIPKEKVAINKIFESVHKNKEVPYGNYLNWVHRALADRYKKK